MPHPPPKVDRLGALLALLMAAALALPFVVFKANRIVPGVTHRLWQALPPPTTLASLAAVALAALATLFAADARARLAAALIGVIAVALAVAAAGNALTPPGNLVVRVAPGSGFWLLFIAFALAASDAITRLRPGPLLRVLMLAAAIGVAGAGLAHGTFDHLSVMREYAVHEGRFAHEARRHLQLAFGSLGAAILVALPLGILCHRVPRLRAAVLGTLNFIQTIPAIALFGILMAPLGALAAAMPLAARVGIRGIGVAPAVIALFLYSLLPVAANTVAGLGRVSPAAVDAARGMGMTSRQILFGVEFTLALPVILTGIRIVMVQNIGLVTVAALIGAGGLGTFVFQGIGETAIDLVLLGAIPTVVMAFASAIVLDALVDALDRTRR